MRVPMSVALAVVILAPCRPALAQGTEQLAVQVREAETAFAATMATRDHAAFGGFVADEAIFFGRSGPLRGRVAVLEDGGRSLKARLPRFPGGRKSWKCWPREHSP